MPGKMNPNHGVAALRKVDLRAWMAKSNWEALLLAWPVSTTQFRCRGPAEGPLWVTGGKTPSEDIFSELPQVADINRSAFTVGGGPPYCRSLHSGVRAIPG